MADLHLVYTDSGDAYGWTIESPQIPELIGGRDTSEELLADTADIVEFAIDQGAEFDRIYRHEQHLVVDPEGREYLIRWEFDGNDADERYDTASRLNFAVGHGLMDESELEQQPTLPTTGERLMIAVVASDTLGWIEDQLSERSACCVLVQGLGNGALTNVPFGIEGFLGCRRSTKELGLTRSSTIQEMVDAVLAAEVEDLRTTHLPPDASDEIPRHMPNLTSRA